MGAADLRHPLRAEGRGHALVEVVATTSIGIVVLGANRANVVGWRLLRPGRPGRRRGVDVDRRRRVASRARRRGRSAARRARPRRIVPERCRCRGRPRPRWAKLAVPAEDLRGAAHTGNTDTVPIPFQEEV